MPENLTVNQSEDEQKLLQKYLHEVAGIDSASVTIDPASMEALKQMVIVNTNNNIGSEPATSTDKTNPPSLSSSKDNPSAVDTAGRKVAAATENPSSLTASSVGKATKPSASTGSVSCAAPSDSNTTTKTAVRAATRAKTAKVSRIRPPVTTQTETKYDESDEFNFSVGAMAMNRDMDEQQPSERAIMDRLDLQMAMLMDMQRNLEQLTSSVQRLEQRFNTEGVDLPRQTAQDDDVGNNTNTRSTNYFQRTMLQMQQDQRQQDQRQQDQRQQQQQQQQQPLPPLPNYPQRQQEEQPNMPILHGFTSMFGFLLDIPNQILESRLIQIIRLFWNLKHHYVRDLEGALMFKVIFILGVLSARMSSYSYSSSKQQRVKARGISGGGSKFSEEDTLHAKIAMMFTLVILGFIVHSGYFNYFYIFFVKEQYPTRIWNGEETIESILQQHDANPPIVGGGVREGEPMQPPLQPVQQNQPAGGPRVAAHQLGEMRLDGDDDNNAAAAIGGGQQQQNDEGGRGIFAGLIERANWRHTIFAGGIPERRQQDDPGEPHEGFVTGILLDIMCLFGSFFLSIFPMWHPERLAVPGRDGNAAAGVAGGLPRQDGNGGPGIVQPPRDPAQPIDDDDNDERE